MRKCQRFLHRKWLILNAFSENQWVTAVQHVKSIDTLMQCNIKNPNEIKHLKVGTPDALS